MGVSASRGESFKLQLDGSEEQRLDETHSAVVGQLMGPGTSAVRLPLWVQQYAVAPPCFTLPIRVPDPSMVYVEEAQQLPSLAEPAVRTRYACQPRA